MLYNVTRKTMVVDDLKVAKTFKERFLGLMFKKNMGDNEGLLILGCSSIHTCFMRFTIDVVFMDINYSVICIKKKIKPWRISGFVHKSYMTLELPEGTVNGKNISLGDILIIS